MHGVNDDSNAPALLPGLQFEPVKSIEDDGKEANEKEVETPDLGLLGDTSGLELDTSEFLHLAGWCPKEIDGTKLTQSPTCPQLSVLYREVILPKMSSVLKNYLKDIVVLMLPTVVLISILYVALINVLTEMMIVLWDVAPLLYATVLLGLPVSYVGVNWFLFCAFASHVLPKSLRAMEEAAKSLPRFGKYRFVLRSKHHRWCPETVYFEVVEDEGIDNGDDEGQLTNV